LLAARPGRALVCTAGGWALFDFGFYGNVMLEPRVLALLLGGSEKETQDGHGAEDGNGAEHGNRADGFVAHASVAIGVAAVGVVFTLAVLPLIPRMGLRNLQVCLPQKNSPFLLRLWTSFSNPLLC
jgi:hypothetical protein